MTVTPPFAPPFAGVGSPTSVDPDNDTPQPASRGPTDTRPPPLLGRDQPRRAPPHASSTVSRSGGTAKARPSLTNLTSDRRRSSSGRRKTPTPV